MADLSTIALGELEVQTRMALAAMPWLTEADRALAAAALETAARIDDELLAGGERATKAMYLTPHLKGLMRELGGSPDSRLESGVKPGGAEDERKSKAANVTPIKDRPKRPPKRA